MLKFFHYQNIKSVKYTKYYKILFIVNLKQKLFNIKKI